ncbi:Maintenance of telomere capping protein 6 [Teratosphaeriaceae sp. CCFEE 6253]|nr:Maintenance of telomere capping protein 6 [Teratosphaeriaceae sp. CCFEE 6253]
MSLYSPDEGAIPRGPAFVSILSQRDLSLQLPIDYVTVPGVSLQAACFHDLRYEGTAAANCLSNLLATGFRRIEIDVYWDQGRRLWSLCPARLGMTGSASNSTSIASVTSTSSATLGSGQLNGRGDARIRQATSTSRLDDASSTQPSSVIPDVTSAGASSNTLTISSLLSASTTANLTAGPPATSAVTTSNSSISPASSPSEDTLIEVGPYSCTASATFELLTSVIAGYLQNTETDLNATIRYLVMNVHAAAPASDPGGSAQRPTMEALPQQNNLLSTILALNNSVYLYTPNELGNERANLNGSGSWFASRSEYRPDPAYFTMTETNGKVTTVDGWPTEGYLELQRGRRLLAGYGRIDPQMMAYNFSGDAQYIFPPGYLQTMPDVSTRDGVVIDGCLYQASQDSVSPINSSWAISSIGSTPQPDILALVGNLTSCGISPFLNTSLNNVSAGRDYTPYQAYASASNWAWASGEPRNGSSDASGDDAVQYSCAALNATTGHWQASDCSQSHFGACRIAETPYDWRISDQRGLYTNIEAGCPDNTTFGVPRTALENTYLLAAWRARYAALPDPDDALLWLDFNDLSSSACWVVGQNTTCPYLPSENHVQGREIAVPVVAAIIVFVLAALTVFVKCAANRQNSRSKRRRGDDGWDYEGVPS